MSDWMEGFARLLAFGEALGTKSDDVLNPAIPVENRFIPPVDYLTAANAASARASGKLLPWKQLYTGTA